MVAPNCVSCMVDQKEVEEIVQKIYTLLENGGAPFHVIVVIWVQRKEDTSGR